MPSECVSCKKKVSDDDEECYCVFKCRKDHIFRLCKVECLRMFEKKCMKVSDNLVRVQHKLNNDGHTSALRRLPPGEREKLKQHAEAESLGLFICPEEVKASERSVPHCAHIMKRVGGYGKDAGPSKSATSPEAEGGAPPPPPAPSRGSSEQLSLELLDDDMLLEIKRDDDSVEMPGESSAKQGKKKKNQTKKGQTLLLDWKMNDREEPLPTASSAPKAAATTTRNPGGIGAAQQAWSAVASRGPDTGNAAAPPWAGGAAPISASPAPARRPENWQERVTLLIGAAGCSEPKAMRLLELNDWHVNRAADAFFREEPSDAEPLRWGQTLADKMKAQPAQTQAQAEQARALQPPAPTIPPPPPLPEGWKALWNEEQGAYYYWHMPTNDTTWDLPELPEGEGQQDSGPSEELARIARVRDSSNLSEAAARSLLEENNWDVDRALQSHARAEAEARRRAQEEEEAKAAREIAEAARRRAEEEAAALARVEAEAAAARAQRCALGRSICIRPFRPFLSGLEACIRLNEGEQVMVIWTDGDVGGWAYGQILDDSQGRKEGYFPQACIKEFIRPSRRIEKGELRQALEPYEGPADVSGYLSLEVGDVLTVLHPVVEPFVWVYAERSCPLGGPPERGWVPEAWLGEYTPKGLQAERGPHPAG
eukprot:TRINITY_DN23937_c0_g1_i2.p1 TRINITY_DN23937_c0_g1~~TRINITY_DN23937_c0_g1_i2.p1  ORF type:complete len:654 (+),score=125.26 TRINITY_DN23937_c0_g1_i2:122-2083(+)